jgi:hypothetical protein
MIMSKSDEYIAKLETALTADDWQYIHYAVNMRFQRAAPKKGEPNVSREFEQQRARILNFLIAKAYQPKKEG